MRIGLPKGQNNRHTGHQSSHTQTSAALPAYAPDLFRFVYFAVGDYTTATELVADVLAQSPQGAVHAVRLLAPRLARTSVRWPASFLAGPWHTPVLQREQAQRLLAALAPSSACDRLALALHLLWDVAHDELDQWLGTTGISPHLAKTIRYAGRAAGLITPTHQYPECAIVRSDPLEASQQHYAEPHVRIHLISCAACRQYIDDLQQSATATRHVLRAFVASFPQPQLEPALAARAQRPWLRRLGFGSATGLVLALLVIALGIMLRPGPQQSSAHEPLSATAVLERALHRFEHAPEQGILHERVRFGLHDEVFHLERWYDYEPGHRLHITLHRQNRATPLLEVVTDGESWVGYSFAQHYGPADEALIRDPEIEDVLPLLRQLPFTGSFGGLSIEQRNLDLTLLARARHGQLAAHGIVQWKGRPAYLLSSQQPDQTKLMLTIDRETLSLLQASSLALQGGAAATTSVWQAEVVEVVPEAPETVFVAPTEQVMQLQFDPRRLSHRRSAAVDFGTALDVTVLPMPATLTEPAVLAYLRVLDWPIRSVLQMYESEWSTLAIVVPSSQYQTFSRRALPHTFAHGRFTTIETDMPNVSLVEFVLDAIPDRHILLYYWHGLLDDVEREATALELLDAMVLVDQTNAAAYRDRFDAPVTSERALNMVRLSPTATASREQPSELTPEMRRLRFKYRQAQGDLRSTRSSRRAPSTLNPRTQ